MTGDITKSRVDVIKDGAVVVATHFYFFPQVIEVPSNGKQVGDGTTVNTRNGTTEDDCGAITTSCNV
jgi:hypothetical protein